VSWAFVSGSAHSGERLIEVVPAWLVQSILPIGFFLIAYRYLVWTVHRVRGYPGSGDETVRLEVPR
jgi:TRAP-type C4-dicarboxylate transport system permease small subunit